ncbi:MAG: HDOD domain-containing protein, partial [Deltaproteobacteria bacterium]|nr:HDOD domain-containing protein [Deltaproteobacteria bacterium]MBW2114877.1 HDOD domain-containing protein [Deltaproteobacteria bacterium]MBW2357967.1 HDOD domain-containing protein [Deltaproteobacteria bacterium]
MENRQKAKLLKKIVNGEGLPSLSPLAIQLVELATDDRSSARDLAAIIEKDPGLTTRLLKLVGSAFFARSKQVTSISQAVVLLGFKRVRIMGLSLSLRDTFPMGRKKGMDFDHFWKTSLYRALIAQNITQSTQPHNLKPEEAFVGGLILEIGMLLLFEACSEEIKKGFPGGNLPLEKAISWEEENLGINHRDAGSLVLRRWRFSDNLVESQKYFGPEALDPDKPILCKIIELARRATEIVFGQTTDLYELQQLSNSVLKLKPATINEILSESFNRVEDLAEQLRIKVDSQTDIIRVMEKANLALARISASMETSLRGLLDHVGQYDRSLTRITKEMAKDRKDILQNTLDAVAHEIRNPLLAIGGFAGRLARQAEEEDRGRQYAKIIAEESTRLERILKEIMDYSQAYEPEFSEKDLVSIMNKVLNEFEDLFREKNIHVVRDFPQEPVRAPVDVDGIARVLRQV